MTRAEIEQSGLPRYYQLSNVLSKRIEQGVYKLGELLPTENELCEEFDVSRYTVREALRRLTEAGLVKRRQGSGSQVIQERAGTNYVHSMRSLSELFQYAAETKLDIDAMEERTPPPEFAAYLGDEAAMPWLHLDGVRKELLSGTPIAYSNIFINRRFAGVKEEIVGYSGAIYDLIEGRYDVRVADVEQEIKAHPISKKAARLLGVSVRTWAVQVVRRYISNEGQVMVVSLNDHPGERFSYKMHLRREGLKNAR
jgi:DNA-binding GntR family transcriptional regulator